MLCHSINLKWIRWILYTGLTLSSISKRWKLYIAKWKKHQSHFTLHTMEKWRPWRHLPGDGPRLGRMSAYRSGSDTVIGTRPSSSWTQKGLKAQILEVDRVFWRKISITSSCSYTLTGQYLPLVKTRAAQDSHSCIITLSWNKERRDGGWKHELIGNGISWTTHQTEKPESFKQGWMFSRWKRLHLSGTGAVKC